MIVELCHSVLHSNLITYSNESNHSLHSSVTLYTINLSSQMSHSGLYYVEVDYFLIILFFIIIENIG